MWLVGVHAYELLIDVAHKLHKEVDDIFLVAVIENHCESVIPLTELAATLYDRYENLNEIPQWLQDWCIDIMIGRHEQPNGLVIINAPKKRRGGM